MKQLVLALVLVVCGTFQVSAVEGSDTNNISGSAIALWSPSNGTTVIRFAPDDALRGKIVAAIHEMVTVISPQPVDVTLRLHVQAEYDLDIKEVLRVNAVDPGKEISAPYMDLPLGVMVGDLYFEVGDISFLTKDKEVTQLVADILRNKFTEIIGTYIRTKVNPDRKG